MELYNEMPRAAVKLTDQQLDGQLYRGMQGFFEFRTEREENRQVLYEQNNHCAGIFKMRIFWVKEKMGLGYGIAYDWKRERIDIYRFGTVEDWQKFKQEFAARFRYDNS